MRISKTHIKSLHPFAESITQIDSKQLFKVYYIKGTLSYTLLISYQTIVGISIDSEQTSHFYITKEKFSCTTSKQLTVFMRDNSCERVSPATLELLLRVCMTLDKSRQSNYVINL